MILSRRAPIVCALRYLYGTVVGGTRPCRGYVGVVLEAFSDGY